MSKWKLFPDVIYPSAYAIDYQALYEKGIRGVIYDIDNTLVGHGAPADARSVALFRKLDEIGLEYCLVSNNDAARVDLFNTDIHAHCVYKAGKPLKKGYLAAAQKMQIAPEQTAAIGDQIFTDVWGANRAGVYCIMTRRLYFKEPFQIHLKRILEAPILLAYHFFHRK